MDNIKLYLWFGFDHEYNEFKAHFALAESSEEAKKLVSEKYKKDYEKEIDEEVFLYYYTMILEPHTAGNI